MRVDVARMGTFWANCLAVLMAAGAAPAMGEPGDLQTDPAAATSPTLALVGGRLIDGYGGAPVDNALILIEGNRISKVGRADELDASPAAQILDFSGMSVLPGLWESHGHLFHAGEGNPSEFQQVMSARAMEIMAAVARASLLAGITSFRDTGGPLELQLDLRNDIDSGKTPGPRLFLAGTILRQGTPDADCSGASCRDLVSTPKEAQRAVERLVGMGADQIKVYGFWDQEILEAVTAAAHQAGVGVDADVRHRSAYLTAIKAGVDRLHHVFVADPLSGYSAEDMRILIGGWKPTGAGPSANIIRGPYIIPTVEVRQAYVRVFAFPGLLDHHRLRAAYGPELYDYLRGTWKQPAAVPWGIGAPERIEVAREKLRRFVEAGGREQLVAGTDAGSPFNLHSPLTKEIRHLHAAGLSPMEAIQAATLRPAQMQGVEQELGTVSTGKLADLIIVDGDPLQDLSLLEHRVVVVIKDGKAFFPDHNFPRPSGT